MLYDLLRQDPRGYKTCEIKVEGEIKRLAKRITFWLFFPPEDHKSLRERRPRAKAPRKTKRALANSSDERVTSSSEQFPQERRALHELLRAKALGENQMALRELLSAKALRENKRAEGLGKL